jgi:RNA polymerase I-specific transcription initiation factor RRN6
MADSTLSHLNYGHAGTTTFDTDARDWSFARQFTATTLKQIGIRDRTSIDAIPAPVQFPNTASSTRLTNTRDNARALVRNYPQLVPASQLLPDLAATSAAVISTASTYDPLIGTLFSTGSITYVNDRAGKWDNPRRVAAMVTGEAGNILRLGFLYQHALGWGSDKSVWIRGDTLRSTESGYWNEEAAPIQQVCFSQSEDRSTLLAVRLLTKTVIFRPFYSQRPRPAKQSPYYNLPPSLIDANPILTLENDESGGSPHADVTFNPDFQLQFAVVDQNQIWSVWDIDHKRKSTEYKISGVAQGSIVPAEEAEPIGEDGWARILWVGDVNTILVCNRRRLSIIGLKGNTFEYLPCSAVVPARTSDWILDVKRHPSLRNRFFALTSTDVLLMGVTTRSEAVDATVGPVGARVLLSWRHYRGAEDFTLSITVSMLDEDCMCTTFLYPLRLIVWQMRVCYCALD